MTEILLNLKIIKKIKKLVLRTPQKLQKMILKKKKVKLFYR